jgi:hypothetical protein
VNNLLIRVQWQKKENAWVSTTPTLYKETDSPIGLDAWGLDTCRFVVWAGDAFWRAKVEGTSIGASDFLVFWCDDISCCGVERQCFFCVVGDGGVGDGFESILKKEASKLSFLR